INDDVVVALPAITLDGLSVKPALSGPAAVPHDEGGAAVSGHVVPQGLRGAGVRCPVLGSVQPQIAGFGSNTSPATLAALSRLIIAGLFHRAVGSDEAGGGPE